MRRRASDYQVGRNRSIGCLQIVRRHPTPIARRYSAHQQSGIVKGEIGMNDLPRANPETATCPHACKMLKWAADALNVRLTKIAESTEAPMAPNPAAFPEQARLGDDVKV
jgi:hypothetical protein